MSFQDFRKTVQKFYFLQKYDRDIWVGFFERNIDDA